MPVKIARSTPRPSFGLPELLVASHISRLASRDAAKSLLSTLVSESSGECRIEALYCFHQNNECSKCEVVHTQRRRTLMNKSLDGGEATKKRLSHRDSPRANCGAGCRKLAKLHRENAMSPRTLKRAIAFIDRNVDDLGTLLAGISPHVEPILLSDDEPAPRQLVRAVKGRADLDAIHVIAHGRPGEASFGAGALSLDTTDEHAAELAEVGRMLRGGAIHLWTCETARGRRGAAFIEALARASGAPIAASTQRVGAAAGGGRWQLDARPGAIHASAPLTAQGVASYAGVMSGGPALSLSSTIFTDNPSPHAP